MKDLSVCTPQFTVGIPVHRGMPWLRDAVRSLQLQFRRDFETLIILDGEDPESLTYLSTVDDLAIRVLQQPHRGLVPTLNRMLREARTPWLVRQDADDISFPHRIDRLHRAIRTNPDAGLIYSRARYYSEAGAVGYFRSSIGSPHQLRRIVQEGQLPAICHSSVVLNVEKTLAAGGYRAIFLAEDADLWWRMALRYDVHCIPDVLVGFRQSDHSLSNIHLHNQQIAGLYVQYLLLSHLWDLSPRPIECVQDTLSSFVRQSQVHGKRLLRNMNICFGQGRYAAGVAQLLQALMHSPGYVIGRARDEFGTRLVRNGLPVRAFFDHREALWS